MDIGLFLAGSGGVIGFGMMAYFTRQIVVQLQRHKDISLAMFFLRDETVRVFKIHTLAMMALSAVVFIDAAATVTGNRLVGQASRIAILPIFAGFIYFYRSIQLATQHPAERSE